MPESLEVRDSAVVSSAGEPGPLSRLLQEIFEAPSEELLDGWKKELQPGDRVGRFEIRREVGRGGFGAVYEAFDTELSRVVAVKTLRLSRPRKDLASDWIKKEAEAVARLDHPCIVTLHDVGTGDSGPYLVMELLRGRTLSRRIADGPIPPTEALRIAEEMAKGLAHAHQRGVLHRDLKPANVFLCEDGRVKLLDFGLAHLLGAEGVTGAGTPTYMAPEQARGEVVDQRADVYAAGRVLAEMVGARRPRRLERAIATATSAEPTARPRDGQAWLDLLQAARHAVERPARMRRIGLIAGAFLVLGIVVAGMASWRLWRTQFLADADGRITVAVADFANQTGDPDLDGLSGLLITSLEQSKRLRVLTRSRMWDHLRAMGKDQVQRIDEPLAREVGERAGARALLLASVRKLDDVYFVEMRAVDPKRDEYLFTVADRISGKKGVLELVDRLSARTRAELHEDTREMHRTETFVSAALTDSLDAYQHYFRGQQLYDQGAPDRAEGEFRKALAKDPRFALAHYALSVCLRARAGSLAERRAHADAAVAEADRLPLKERLLVRAWRARSYWDGHGARALYAQLLEKFPDDLEVLRWAASLEVYGFGDPARALPLLERGRQLDPSSTDLRIQYLDALLSLGRLQEAADFTRRWVETEPSPIASCNDALVKVNMGNTYGALAAVPGCESVRRSDGPMDPFPFAIHLVRGDLGDAARALERLRKGGAGRVADLLQPILEAYVGHRHEARRLSDALAARNDNLDDAEGMRIRADLLAGDGPGPALRDAARAFHEVTASLDAYLATTLALGGEYEEAKSYAQTGNCFYSDWCARFVDALVLRDGGNLEQARTELVELAGAPKIHRRQAASYALADTCHRLGDARCVLESVETFRRACDPDWTACGAWRAWAYPRSLIWSGRAWERLGNHDRARADVNRLLSLWKTADPDLPFLAEAKELRAHLAAAR